jgi:hypothetical protein
MEVRVSRKWVEVNNMDFTLLVLLFFCVCAVVFLFVSKCTVPSTTSQLNISEKSTYQLKQFSSSLLLVVVFFPLL